MMNRTPWWQVIALGLLVVVSLVYALPSLFGERPSVEMSFHHQNATPMVLPVKKVIRASSLSYVKVVADGHRLVVICPDDQVQLKIRDLLSERWSNEAQVALAMQPKAPAWLLALGAHPINLGLDLRGGVHFLLDVNVDAVVRARLNGVVDGVKQSLRQKHVRYTHVSADSKHGFQVVLLPKSNASYVETVLENAFPDYVVTSQAHIVTGHLKQDAYQQIAKQVIAQNMTTLTNRVNELGLSEAVIQQQGMNHISVDLPGIQDIARAKSLIGKTATLRFQMVDEEHSLGAAVEGQVPLGSHVYYKKNGQPVLLKDPIILSGQSITGATTGTDQMGQPDVNVFLGGGGEARFYRETSKNIGKLMAVVYVEMKPQHVMKDGKPAVVYHKHESVISVATIQSALSNQFQITGHFSVQEANELAMLLRSGSFAAPVAIVQESTVGPSLGQANIDKGVLSLEVGSLVVVVFMLIYYGFFGLVADLALMLNVVLIVAVLSVLGATLTLAGMAGIVLTVGMAVDANVLIYERIREELRLGRDVQTAIQTGYERAFVTIVDSNVTTLIVALILFALGSASVKGFAVTLSVGLVASMVTAISFTRAIINARYGGKSVDRISIGM